MILSWLCWTGWWGGGSLEAAGVGVEGIGRIRPGSVNEGWKVGGIY